MAIASSSTAAIQQAYLAYYGRPADLAGQQYWARVLDQEGGRLDKVIEAFGRSPESTQLYGGSSTAERVEKIYRQLFNREPEAGGKLWWTEQIDSGQVSLQSAALQIMAGASNEDWLLIQRKLQASSLFTEALRSKHMGHAYTDADIAVARDFLSGVTLGLSDADLQAHLQQTLLSVYDAGWTRFSVAPTNGFSTLGAAAAMVDLHGELVFGQAIRPSSGAETDVLLASLDHSLQPGWAMRIGHAQFSETLYGMADDGAGGLLLWGDLDRRFDSAEANTQFVWKLDAGLNVVAEARIGTPQGSAPKINKVMALADGRTLVLGQQNNVGDAWDAFAIVFDEDLTVLAQQRFDSPSRIGSNENFVDAVQLPSGELVLMGERGELFKVTQSLQRVGTSGKFLPGQVFSLEDGLLLLVNSNGSQFQVRDADLKVLAYFSMPGNSRELLEQAPGRFMVKESGGHFFEWNVAFDREAQSVVAQAGPALQLASRGGSGVFLSKFAVADGTVLGVKDNSVFAFHPGVAALPNLALDYRVVDSAVDGRLRPLPISAQEQPDWKGEALQIVTVGVAPPATADFANPMSNDGISFI